MKVFVLTETDSTAPTWCYNEVFADGERATERLKELYHENITERQELAAKVDDHACNHQNDSQLDQHFPQTARHIERLFLSSSLTLRMYHNYSQMQTEISCFF